MTRSAQSATQSPADPTFFANRKGWRGWLGRHHATKGEIQVGFWKKGSGKASMDWAEAVDEALCFGWIDGVRRSLGDEAFTVRFTPRKPRSIWSDRNVARMAELEAQGKMTEAGRHAFAARVAGRTGVYSFERADAHLDEAQEGELRREAQAWDFWQAQPAGYRKAAAWWVVSAMKDETRKRRLVTLVACCGRGERLPHLVSPSKRA